MSSLMSAFRPLMGPANGRISIGAPRFELGTSSPPDSSCARVPRDAEWREVSDFQGEHRRQLTRRRFLPRPVFRAFGQRLGNQRVGADWALSSDGRRADSTTRRRAATAAE
jgi:hypothetical protein